MSENNLRRFLGLEARLPPVSQSPLPNEIPGKLEKAPVGWGFVISSPVHAVSVRTRSHARWTSAKVVMDAAGELWTYRELFYFLAWRDVKVRYKQTALGIAWAILQPFLTMVVFTLLFGKLAGMPSEGMPYPVFYFGALLPWMYFSTTLTNSGNSLVANAHLITKVYFPRLILPTAAAFSGLVDFAVGCVLLSGSWRITAWCQSGRW